MDPINHVEVEIIQDVIKEEPVEFELIIPIESEKATKFDPNQNKSQKFKCELCKFESKYRSTVLRHMTSKHLVDKKPAPKFQCDICGSFKSDKFCLQNHLLTHFDSLKIKCSHCDKALGSKRSLDRHMATHRNEKFSCPLCLKVFGSIRNLMRHQRIHTGEILSFQARMH